MVPCWTWGQVFRFRDLRRWRKWQTRSMRLYYARRSATRCHRGLRASPMSTFRSPKNMGSLKKSGPPIGPEGAWALMGAGKRQRVGFGWVWWQAFSLPRSSCGSTWTLPPNQPASPSLQVRRRPELPQCWLAVPSSRSRCSWAGSDNTPLWISSSWWISSRQSLRDPPPGWPEPAQSPGHPICSTSWWQARVGAGGIITAEAALCAGGQRHGTLVSKRWMAS